MPSLFPPPFGPEGRGVLGFGRAIDETSEDPLTLLDIVGHELMHGVTHFSVSNRTGSPMGLFNPVPLDVRLGPESFTTRDGETLHVRHRTVPRLGRDNGRDGGRAGPSLVYRRPVCPRLLGRRRHP